MTTRIEISPGLYILAAAGLLLLPIHAFVSAIFTATFHELCHIVTLALFRIPIHKISVGIGGAKIHVPEMNVWQEFISAAAGPAGSIFLWLAHRQFPVVAVFGLIQGVFNLLPIYPLDGGRMLRCILESFIPGFAKQISTVVGYVTVGCVMWLVPRYFPLNLSIIASVMILAQCRKEKLLAKMGRNRYNSFD